MSVKDANLLVRTAGALTATSVQPRTTLAGGTGKEGMGVLVQVPSVTGTSPSLVVSVRAGSSSSTSPGANDEIARGRITAAGAYFIPFVSKHPYYKIALTVAGSTPNFGATLVSIVRPAYIENKRNVVFL